MAQKERTEAVWLKFRSAGTQRAFEPIVGQVRKAIYAGELRPGDKLPTERELSEIFQASRVSVRNAMLSLEQAGFLEIKKGANGGFYIRELDDRVFRDSLRDLLQMHNAPIVDLSECRGIIEPQAAALAARRALPEDIRHLESTISNFNQRTRLHAAPDLSDLDFHEAVAQAAHNAVILFVLRALNKLLYKSIGDYDLPDQVNRRIVEDHSLVLRAIKARDAEMARNCMFRHLDVMQKVFASFKGNPTVGSEAPAEGLKLSWDGFGLDR